MDLELAGRACIVTGASSGIGAATARALAAERARVLLVARNEERLAEVAAGCGDAATLGLDVTTPDAGDRAVLSCVERFGSVDVLVNNAGTSRVRPLDELTDEDWQEQWELHVMASLRLMRAAAPRMAERGWGRVVNVCSSSGKRPSSSNVAYSVTKSAQLALSRAFAGLRRAGRPRERGGARPGRVAAVDRPRRTGRAVGGALGSGSRGGA